MDTHELKPDESAASSKITVLLIDDQAFIGKIVGRMLNGEKDIDFHYFQSAREALKTADKIAPSVILQDLVMPEIDGLHMVSYFRAKKKTSHTPLIVLSGHEDPKIKAQAFELGANDYMVKPPNRLELVARIRYHSQAYINRLERDEAYSRVEEQTVKLKQTNEQLLEQIAERKRIEKALLESKKKAEMEREAAETANKKVMDSIRYAQLIQNSLLPNPENIRTFLPDSFFIWMPRDIVGGDFIFTDCFEDSFIIGVIDCTGHGVPGAFMTMITSFGLRKIIRDEGFREPSQILKRLSFIVKTTLQQDTDYALSDDGLDAAICFVSMREAKLTFSGAKLPLIYTHQNKIKIIKGNNKSIGYKKSDLRFNFTEHKVGIRRGMSFYMFSDGYVDQLGEKNDRRFGTKRLKNLLKENTGTPFDMQREILLQAFEEYRGENEIQDDVTVLGFGFGTDD
ncbi:response regulator [Desulfococcaceae bacterium HSG8]|nr:response regulator [Desulfococcaceae bacterium HSG8]